VRRDLVLTAVAAGLVVLYLVAFVYMVAFVAIQPTPVWWQNGFGTDRSAQLAWLFSFHAAGVVLVSIPFAFVIARVYRRFGVLVACVVTLVVWGTIDASLMADALKGAAFGARGFWIADSVELLGSLPALVWIMQRLPSNHRWRGP
jgi:hypothetical protein